MRRQGLPGILILIFLLCAGCSTQITKPAGALFKVDDKSNEAPDGFGLMNEFMKARLDAKASGSTPAQVLTFVDRGVSLSNAYCNAYLDLLNSSDQQTSIWQDAINILGAGAIAIAGLNGSSSESLGKAAAGLTAGNALFESYRANVLLAPANAITKKVKEYRDTQADIIRADKTMNYDVAVGSLLQYHDTCSPKEIRQLVADSLAAVAYVAPADPEIPPEKRAEADQLRRSIFQAIHGSPGMYSDEFYFRIYAVVTHADMLTQAPYSEYIAQPPVKVVKDELDKLQKAGETVARYNQAMIELQRLADLLNFDKKIQAAVEDAEDRKAFIAAPSDQKDAVRKAQAARKRLNAPANSGFVRPVIVSKQ